MDMSFAGLELWLRPDPGPAAPEAVRMSAGGPLLLVAVILGFGVGAQILADRFQIPSVLFLIATGIALGPEGLGILTPATFTGALTTIVGVSVAIIVFEGAFHLKIDKLRAAPSETIRLVTVGAVIALVGTALAVRVFLNAGWGVALLVGALLVATGPTVIAPILAVVPVRDRVGTALETEGIVNDVTAAILAVVIFEAIRIGEQAPSELLRLFVERLGVGVAVGALVAGGVWATIRFLNRSPSGAPQNARLTVVIGAVIAFSIANTITSEAGVAAVAAAGMLLGNVDLPYEADIERFGSDITLIVLSFVFISLAALLRFEDLIRLGVGGLALVLVIVLVIRPIGVFLSTAGERFTTREQIFMSAVGPRGIIPASVATLFAFEFRTTLNNPEAASLLVGAVFLVILSTVVFEAGLARYIAEYLDVIPMRVLIIGGGQVGRALADRLDERGENVVIIEEHDGRIETARSDGHTVHIGDGTDTDVLRAAGADNAKIVVAATGDDDTNLLVAQLARSTFDVDDVLARANNPDNVAAFEELGVMTVSSALATAYTLDNLIERPAISRWMSELGASGDVQEIEVVAEELVGRTVGDLRSELPENCLLTLVSRDGETSVPNDADTLERGDHVTLLGETSSVRDVARRYQRAE